jgi:hypothetical protein
MELIKENQIHKFDDESYIGEEVLARLNSVLLWMGGVTDINPVDFINETDFVCGYLGEISFQFDWRGDDILVVCKADKLIVVRGCREQLIFEDYLNLESDKFF